MPKMAPVAVRVEASCSLANPKSLTLTLWVWVPFFNFALWQTSPLLTRVMLMRNLCEEFFLD